MLVRSGLVALGATLAAAVKPISVEGNFFKTASGERFQMVGVAYQPGGSAGYKPGSRIDPLSDEKQCLRDAALMQVIGANTIRIYNLDPDVNHDKCASIFNAAGIYMVLDVNAPDMSLTSTKPWESYYAAYLNRTFAIVDAFKGYPNTLAFFSGNEVINELKQGGVVPPYVRAVTRDLKAYVAKHADRKIPIGYSAADVREVLADTFNYLQCTIDGEKDDLSHADIFALNSYSWCGNVTFQTAGYDGLVNMFKDSSVPVFLSEYGCNKVKPRKFSEVSAIYSSPFTDVFSGAIVYQYTQEENDYGLVKVNADNTIKLLDDYYAFKKQLEGLDWNKLLGTKVQSKTVKAPKCASSLIHEAGFSDNFTIPALPPGTSDIIKNGVSPTVSGRLTDVSSWTVPYAVANPDGSKISALVVKKLANDAMNRPGSNTGTDTETSSSTNTGSSPSPTKTGDSAGSHNEISFVAVAMGALAVMVAF